MLQLSASIEKHYLEKRRNIRVTLCECCSHLVIVIVLLLGFGLSKIVFFSSAQYDSFEIEVPPRFIVRPDESATLGLRVNAVNFGKVLPTVQGLLAGPIVVPSFDSYITVSQFISAQFNGRLASLFLQTSFGQAYGNLVQKGSIHFAPYPSDRVENLISYLNRTTSTFRSLTVITHASEGDAIRYILTNIDERAFALIVLRQITPKKINYVIRLNYTTLPDTNQIISSLSLGLDTSYQQYFLSGFLTLQNTIDAWAFDYTGASTNSASSSCSAPPNIMSVPFPTYEYKKNPFYPSVGFLLGLALTMSTLYPVSRLIKSIVEEKETKMREVMKIMGLRDWVHQLTWFLVAFVVFFWIAVSTTAIAKRSFLPHTNSAILFAYFFLFCMSEITLAFLISVFFSNSKLAAICGPVVLNFFTLPKYIFFGTNSHEGFPMKVLASLLSPTAFTFGADIISNAEYNNVGVQFSTIGGSGYTMLTCLGMMLFDIFLYGFLAWYFDQVLPHEYGTPKHPLFLFSPSYWGCKECVRAVEDSLAAKANVARVEVNCDANNEDGAPNDSVQLMSEVERSLVRVSIKHLRKRYPDGKLAVKELNLSMVEGEVTCLLGHNGAGKSTTIAVLTGITEPTAGRVSIFGHRLDGDLYEIRSLTGICPQQNVLFPTLTVREHLMFFGAIKGLYLCKLRQAVKEIINDVGLVEKADSAAASLSGGMKRKLCLAMALIGDPKFVVLDEPTSGMDPYSRRAVWDLLQRQKVGRVIMLTTHYMDEADIVSDRIAIMSEGRLRCAGTALFLKNRFGAGYVLSIAKSDHLAGNTAITAGIQSVISTAEVASAYAGEVMYQIPLDMSSRLADLFGYIQSNMEALGISTFGVSITSLEQVFIRLAQEGDKLEDTDDDDDDGSHFKILSTCSKSISTAWVALRNLLPWLRSPSEEGGAVEVGQGVESSSTSSPVEVQGTQGGTEASKNATINGDNDATPQGLQEPSELLRSENTRPGTVVADTLLFPMGIDIWGSVYAVGATISNVYAGIPFGGVSTEEEEGPKHTSDLELTTMQGLQHSEPAPPTATSESVPTDPVPISEPVTRGRFSTQFFELLRKRYILASRDLKGLFFQVLFPAIQILLVLAILTVKVNPAGHTVKMEAEVFGFRPLVYVAGTTETTLASHLSETRMELAQIPYCLNSSSVSERMLVDPLFQLPNQFGAFTFNDTVRLNVTVDWKWVRNNIETLLSDPTVTKTVISLVPYRYLDITPLLANLQQAFGVSPGNALLTLIPSLAQTQNFSILLPLLLTSSNSTARSGPPVNTYVTTRGLAFNEKSKAFIVDELTIHVGNVTVPLGNFSFPLSTIVALLPNVTERYLLSIPSSHTIMHNSSSQHAVAIFNGELRAAYFSMCSPAAAAAVQGDGDISEPVYLAKNHPLPITQSQALELRVILSFLASVFILVPLCYIPAAFVSFVVKERACKSKHLQIVSSVDPTCYWLATYTWDMALFSLLVFFVMMSFLVYGRNASQIFISDLQSGWTVFLLVFLYGCSVMPLCYLYSFFFDNYSTCQISVTAINFFTGFVFVLAYFIMISVPETYEAGTRIVHFFRFFPPYNIGEGLIAITLAYFRNTYTESKLSYLDWNVAGRNLCFMFVEAVGYLGIVLLTESTAVQDLRQWLDGRRAALAGRPPTQALDDDVAVERAAVTSVLQRATALDRTGSFVPSDASMEEGLVEPISNFAFLLSDVVKTYPPAFCGSRAKHAVQGMTLGIRTGERFGLLGVNGAGKSTTMNILTGDTTPTSGQAFVCGNMLSDPATRLCIGYCPQTDPLLDLMTAYETLWFFGRTRGIPEHILTPRVASLIEKVGLRKHAHRVCGNYSGGNKRKLSLAIALIGDPKVLLLDEPSSGMDPEARRQMWNVISSVSENRSVVLTTHSMEECEALCSRICIMVKGQMQCLGSSQHIKSRFGHGYEVQIRCSFSMLPSALALYQITFPDVTIDEQHGDFARLRHARVLDLEKAFRLLEENKVSVGILDYSISQTTLDQIFVGFAEDGQELDM